MAFPVWKVLALLAVGSMLRRFFFRREYEPFMLNGDAHHSLVWEVEPRICRC